MSRPTVQARIRPGRLAPDCGIDGVVHPGCLRDGTRCGGPVGAEGCPDPAGYGLDVERLHTALDRALGPICRADTHGDARRIISDLLAVHAPQYADVEIEVCTHCVDGEVGPAYVAHLGPDTATPHTLFVSVEFGCASVVQGIRWPSYWN